MFQNWNAIKHFWNLTNCIILNVWLMPQYEKKRLQLESFYEHRTNQANTIINLIKLQKLHSRTQPLMWICRYSDMLVGSCCRVHTPSLFFFFSFFPRPSPGVYNFPIFFLPSYALRSTKLTIRAFLLGGWIFSFRLLACCFPSCK